MAKTDKKNEVAKIQVEKVKQVEQAPYQILKEQPVEHIPNAHLAHQQLVEVDLHPTLSQEELVVIPIFVAADTDIQSKSIFEEVEKSFPANVEGSEEFNEANKIKKSPMTELIDFINANAKDFLIERNLLISLYEKANELKAKEKQLLTEWISKSYLLGYSDCETEKEQEVPNFYEENFEQQ
jgi:hypothetical protein